ncbi:MAG: hypothetical protein IJB96_10365, partial [Lachnospira sp.]|nr:hypothetical protein [Lachnospira sp.]
GANASIKVKVAGNATVTLSLCQYANAGNIEVTCPEGGTVTPASVAAAVGTDGATQSFVYTGEAGELVFTYTGSGSAYLHAMTVMNEAAKTTVKEQTAMPEILTNIGTGSSLTVTPSGQKLVLVQTGGAIGTVDGKVSPSLSYYGFPATSALNKLEMDVVLNSGLASNTSGIYVGAFNETGVSLLGIRNLTNLRGMYSKSASDMAGAGLVDATVAAGSKVHFVVEKTADKFIVTATDENGKAYEAEFKYNNDKHLLFLENGKDAEVSFGFMVSNATATVTNMKYYDSEGNVLYSQNDCYAPIGTAPIASGINAEVADTRDSISVTWDIAQAASGDGVFVLEMRYNDGEWVVLDETTETSYVYPLTKSGKYEFRVAGKLGSDGELNGYVNSEPFSITAALPKPVVTATATESSILLTWAAIDGAVKYEVYRYSYDEGVAGKVLLATVNAADGTEYADAVVDKDMPYYYTVIAHTEDNFSNPSDAVWAVVASDRTGEYVYEDEATEIFITKKSYDTVFNGEVVLEGAVGAAGSLQLVVNGENVGDAVTLKKNGTFAFETNVPEGRNEVELIFTDEAGNKTRQAYNFVYLTNYDFVVDKTNGTAEGVEINGKMTFNTIQAAVDAANGATRVVILVLAGDYEERLVVTKANVSIIGEDRENTLIHCYPADEQWGMGSAAEAGGDMDKRCAVYVQSTATNFSIENISIKNDYDYLTPDNKSNKSADAFRCDADNASYVNVKFTGVQDTLYLHAGKHYLNKCVIEGSVDFIYSGDANAVFDDCTIRFVYVETRDNGVICAPKTGESVAYGLVFNNCVITADERCTGTKYYLARPWGADASVIWVNTYMGNILNAEVSYDNMSGNLASNARFYEFGSYGPGYAINAGRRQISETEANAAVASANSAAKASDVIGSTNYVGDVTSDFEDKYVEDTYVPDITYGDLSGDGEVDTVDAVMIKQMLAGMTGLEIDEDAADVNGDGVVNTVDAVMIMQKLAGMDIELGK